MANFIEQWKDIDVSFAQLLTEYGFVDVPDLRKLSMQSEEDKWFVQNVTSVPKPKGKAHDYMQMYRLLHKSTLRQLYEQGLFSSEYLVAVEKVIKENKTRKDTSMDYLREVLLDLYFKDTSAS